jgi:hypothetical protein
MEYDTKITVQCAGKGKNGKTLCLHFHKFSQHPCGRFLYRAATADSQRKSLQHENSIFYQVEIRWGANMIMKINIIQITLKGLCHEIFINQPLIGPWFTG